MLWRIGIDGGGTKTAGVLISDAGEIVARSESGPSNFLSVGLDTAVKNIENVVYDLCLKKDLLPKEVKIAIGVAGAGRENDKLIITQGLSGRGWDFILNSDAYIALMAATEGSDGIATIAGTGSIAYGVKNGIESRAGGWGYLLGDEGSGYYIGRRAMIEACRSYDGRAISSKLTQVVLDYFACDNQDDFVQEIYEHPPIRQQIAGLTRKVADLASKENDTLAISILNDAGRELALATVTVANKLGLTSEEFPIGLIGGVFKAGDFVLQPFTEQVKASCPKANIGPCKHEPAVGAALMIEPKLSEEALTNLRNLSKEKREEP